MKILRIFVFSTAFLSLFGGLSSMPARGFENSATRRSFTDSECSDFDFDDGLFVKSSIVEKPISGGIKEVIPKQFQERFQKWKAELLTTEVGREQWQFYATNKQFNLTIEISSDKQFAAKTGDYEWTENGELVGATIVLGKNLDKGFPSAIYYPVMNSLSLADLQGELSGNVLAATKLAHEIGHVNKTANTNSVLFQRQNSLIAAYYKIFLKNGYDAKDERLVKLAAELGALPIQIWADREYWGETNAARFLAERTAKERFSCSIFGQIKRNINDYAKNYEDRFDQIPEMKLVASCQN